MKKFTTCLFTLFSLSMLSLNAHSAPTGCEAKKIDVQQQINYAKAHGNNNQVAGLEKALSEIQSNCTESSLRAERETKIDEKKKEVAEREAELAAVPTNDSDKVAKKTRKLQEAQTELEAAKAALNQ